MANDFSLKTNKFKQINMCRKLVVYGELFISMNDYNSLKWYNNIIIIIIKTNKKIIQKDYYIAERKKCNITLITLIWRGKMSGKRNENNRQSY